MFRMNARFIRYLARYIPNSAVASQAGSQVGSAARKALIIVALSCHSLVLSVMRRRNSRENIVVTLARVLASGLILNATFPVDILAQAAARPTAVVQPAVSQSFNAEQLDATLASSVRIANSSNAQHDYFDLQATNRQEYLYATRFISTPQASGRPIVARGCRPAREPVGSADRGDSGGRLSRRTNQWQADPYEGYNFRILKAQGPNCDGGARSYMQSGRLFSDFAFVAWPAVYASGGIMTFIPGPDGDVYQKDLRPETASIAATMSALIRI
jgi:hypothetical protein